MKLRYKNYIGSFEFDEVDKEYHGHVIGIKDIVHFCAKSKNDLQRAFEESVEDYLDMCKDMNKLPEKSCSGELRFRTTPEVHMQLSHKAQYKGISINSLLESAVLSLLKEDSAKGKK